MTGKGKQAAIQAAEAWIAAEYGPGALMRMGELPSPCDSVITTGVDDLDNALGVGGIPRGRIVEIYGPENAGKTALALLIAGQVPTTLYIDAEHSLSPYMCWGLTHGAYAAYVLDADTLEDALQACIHAAPSFDLIVIDTLSALPTKEDLRVSLGESARTNPPARILAHALPQIKALLAKSGCTLVLVNQLREKIGVVYGNPETVPGGHALRHYADIRLDVRRLEVIRQAKQIIGQNIRVKVVKNKCAPPFREAKLRLVYGEGIQRDPPAAPEAAG